MSRPAVRIAVVGVAIGLAVMIVAVSVVVGFKNEVANQVIGFGSHIQIASYSAQTSYERPPIVISEAMRQQIAGLDNVKAVQNTITKPAIIKTDSTFQGVVFKGVDATYQWDFFRRNLVEGTVLSFDSTTTNHVMLSKKTAEKLGFKVGDSFNCYFVQEQVRARKCVVAGIFQTTFDEYDRLFILGDLRVMRQLNAWDSTQISTLEIVLDRFDRIDETAFALYGIVGNRFDEHEQLYQVRTIEQLVPQIFDWLERLDMNAWAILALMLIVAGFNMISGLLIIILERTTTIGILKALGTRNWSIRRVFLYHALFLVGKGMLWGNLIGVTLIALQHFFHLIPLNAEVYYVSYVPVATNLWLLLALNVGTFVAALLMMILPTWFITKITPVKAMRFD